MFWPPNFTANNTVVLSDSRYAAINPSLGPRFDPFEMPACVIAPWMSWAVTDSKFVDNDAIMRCLLVGEPSAQLLSLNADGVGAIITLGTVGAGVQRWEVVTYFDWYVASNVGKTGAMVWCRLWDGSGGSGALSIIGDRFDNVTFDPSYSFDVLVADGYIFLAIVTDVDPGTFVSVELDGVAMTFFADFDFGTGLHIGCWICPIHTGDAGSVTVDAGAFCTIEYWCCTVRGATSAPFGWGGTGSASSPLSTGSPDATFDSITVAMVACVTPSGVLVFDPDFNNVFTPIGSGSLAVRRASYRGPNILLSPPDCGMSSITAADWGIVLANFE